VGVSSSAPSPQATAANASSADANMRVGLLLMWVLLTFRHDLCHTHYFDSNPADG
jgi:hypothetical protein